MASKFHLDEKRVVALLVGAAIIALVAGWFGARMPSGTGVGVKGLALTDSQAAPDASHRLAALEQRVERMAGQIDRLAGATASGRARPGMAHAPAESVESAAEMGQAQRQMAQSHATQFQAESVDPRWSASTEAALRRIGSSDAILSIEARPPDRQVIDCRRTRCRMEFDFADSADAEDWTLAYLTSLGGTLSRSQYFVSKGPTGRTLITLYGQR